MAFSVKLSEQAADDLETIVRYICEDLGNPRAAERFYQAVGEKLDLLRSHPKMFPLYHDEKLSAGGYRCAVTGSFLIFYLVDEEKLTVTAVRILYGRRDISRLP